MKMKMNAAALLAATALSANAASAGDVEVLHWWTSGGEAAALNVLKQDLESQGIGWLDMPVAGGGGGNAMTVLRARVTAGNAPTAVQMLGFDILDWAKEGALADLNEQAAAMKGWDAGRSRRPSGVRKARRQVDLCTCQCSLHQLGLGEQGRSRRQWYCRSDDVGRFHRRS